MSWFCFFGFFWIFFSFVVLRGGFHGGVDNGSFVVVLLVSGVGFRGCLWWLMLIFGVD